MIYLFFQFKCKSVNKAEGIFSTILKLNTWMTEPE